jgi:DNA-binding transcriptional regulator YiaG
MVLVVKLPKNSTPLSVRSATDMSFSDQIRDERKRIGLTQAGAGAVLDTCRGQVAAWESGRNTPHVLTQEGALARLRNRKTPRK